MGMLLNPSAESYRMAVNSKIYIDKSMLISVMNECINTSQRFVCVSRPRRFGKSITADMLCAYYGQEDTDSLFRTLKISGSPDYKKYLNKFQVIHLNMINFMDKHDSLEGSLDYLQKRLLHELKSQFSGVDCFDWNDLPSVLEDIYNAVHVKFVFVIDEWDCIFRRNKNDTENQTLYLDFLRSLLKDKVYVALAYMTGILPIKKYGEHSALNMFKEISVADAGVYAEYTGFTEEEVRELCDKYEMDFDEVKRWYDGYNVNDVSIYNPKSVVEAMLSKELGNYWTQTETYEALKEYIQANFDGLRDKVVQLIADEPVKVNILKFQNDMTNFGSADDVLTLLIHLGYLTYNKADRSCYIPNEEVRQEFINCIEDGGWENVMSAIRSSERLLEDTLKGNEKAVSDALRELHYQNTSLLTYNNENSLSCLLSLAFYSAKKYYTIFRELETGEGFADLVFIPLKHSDKPAMLVELKYDKSVDTAISQIKEKRYHGALTEYLDKLIIVGINYDKNTKEHTCRIERFNAEK
ncbi:ATPase AAA [Ruminococcus albus SY3]|uniref:ATPase AAA n=1 Tax=Ruminococcus albus SY3 TaxID=1341156 RepID=A0A011V4N6_RUMAL|nr:AAA family ATPase [Ruminococcus albus]EXM40467.1 ATPase AAA [Ruminococcus albus SY3]